MDICSTIVWQHGETYAQTRHGIALKQALASFGCVFVCANMRIIILRPYLSVPYTVFLVLHSFT